MDYIANCDIHKASKEYLKGEIKAIKHQIRRKISKVLIGILKGRLAVLELELSKRK
jgi:hypothetical protein